MALADALPDGFQRAFGGSVGSVVAGVEIRDSSWPDDPSSDGYELELSLDGFSNVAFSTRWHRIDIDAPRFRLPDWAWALVPFERPIAWRVLSLRPRSRCIVARGTVERLRPEVV